MATLAAASDSLGGTIYVKADAVGANNGSSWSDARVSLAAALTAAQGGDDIWVAAGVYLPGTSRSSTFELKDGVAVYGGFAGTESSVDERDWMVNVTILSGDLNSDDNGFTNNGENVYRVVTAVAGGTLDGFTIRGGNASGGGGGCTGGGLFIDQSSPTVSNCTFTYNSSVCGGGAAYIHDSDASISNSTFISNRAQSGNNGGAILNDAADPIISNCDFSSNSAQRGGGVASMSGSPILVHCRFNLNSANEGGGLYSGSGSAIILNCRFTGNSAVQNGGGVSSLTATPVIVNSGFVSNKATNGKGGAVYSDFSTPTISNCTLTQNRAYVGGGGIASYSSSFTVTNTVLWGNSSIFNGDEVSNDSSTPTFRHCDVAGSGGSGPVWDTTLGLDGGGNLGTDPRFVDPDGLDNLQGTPDDDLRLLGGSPCIDAGSNPDVAPDTADLDGDGNTAEPLPFDAEGSPRIQNGTVDMGSHEGAHQGLFLSRSTVPVPEGSTASFTVRLALAPQGELEAHVERVSGDVSIDVQSGSLLTFNSSDFSTPKTVQLGGAEDPDFSGDSTSFDVTADGVATLRVEATEVDDDPVPAILYVNQAATGTNTGESWINAVNDLQDAIELFNRFSINEIWVAAGTYKPSVRTNPADPRSATFVLTSVSCCSSSRPIYGGFSGTESSPSQRDPSSSSILSGDLGGDDVGFENNEENVYHVVTTSWYTHLDGFTIEGGNANGLSFPDNSGGGIYNATRPGPNVRRHFVNCVFRRNSATFGGGIYTGTSQSLDDTTIFDCKFYGNQAVLGGAMYNRTAPFLFVERAVFSGNSAAFGGAAYNDDSSNTWFRNAVFIGNVASSNGGAMANYRSSSPRLTNCTLSMNSAVLGAGMYNNSNAAPLLKNCILWGDDGLEIVNDSSTPVVRNSDIQGSGGSASWDAAYGSDGGGNLDADPMYVDQGSPEGPDGVVATVDDGLSLRGASPGVNTGTADGAPPNDIAGTSRPTDGGFEMGAYEFVPPTPTPTRTPTPTSTRTPTATETASVTSTGVPTSTSTSTASATPFHTSTSTSTPSPSSTANPPPATVPGPSPTGRLLLLGVALLCALVRRRVFPAR